MARLPPDSARWCMAIFLRRIAITALLSTRPTRRAMAGRLSGIAISYPRKRDDHRLVGRRMPDASCSGTRVYELLRDGRFLLVTKGGLMLDRADVTCAVTDDDQLPPAVLIRPDGYVAWAGEAAEAPAAVLNWCGRAELANSPRQ